MFYFDVQVLTAFRPKELAAAIIWADVGPVYFSCCTAEMLLASILRIWRWRIAARFFFVDFGGAVKSLKRLLLFCSLLDPRLSLLGLLEQLLLVLLLAQTVQEFVWLRQHLGNESILIIVFNIEYLATHLIVLKCSLVNVAHEIFVLDVNSPELFVIIDIFVVGWWLLRAHYLIHVPTADLAW